MTNTEENPELEHFDWRQSHQTNISEETATLDISPSRDTQEGEHENDDNIKTKETSQLIDVNDEIMENYDSVETSKANGEVELETPDKEKEKETADIKVNICVGGMAVYSNKK